MLRVHQRGRVDVDVIKAGGDRLVRQRLHGLDFRGRIDRVLLDAHLKVVALNEHRPAEPFAQRGGEHAGDVLGGTLIGVRDLRARDLENERASLQLVGRAEDRPRGVVGRATNIDRRDGIAARFAAATRHVQVLDRRRSNSNRLGQLPDQPASVFLFVALAEDRGAHEPIHFRRRQFDGVAHRHTPVLDDDVGAKKTVQPIDCIHYLVP